MLRKYVVQKHVDGNEIDYLVGHHRSIYVQPLGKMVVYFVALYVLFLIFSKISQNPYLPNLFAIVAVLVYAKGIIGFLNEYLDCMVLTARGVVVFKWEGLLEYKTDTLNRAMIQTVSHTQNSLSDKLMQRGDVLVKLEHGVVYEFLNISNPARVANKLMSLKDSYLLADREDDRDHDKFDLLVETLGEVIQDYMGHRKKDGLLDQHHSKEEPRGMFR